MISPAIRALQTALICFFSLILCLSKSASAATATATSLSITSGGSAVAAVTAGTAVALTATVTAAGAAVTPGTVVFCDTTVNTTCNGLAILGNAQLTSSGSATTVLRLGIGSHSLQAVFAGTNTYASSTSAADQLAVSGSYSSATTISAAAGSASGVYNLAATISGFGPLTLTAPTGTLTFVDTSNSNSQLASAPLSSGVVSTALSFVNASNPPVSGLLPSSVTTGDFNGDGKPDFAVADQTNNKVAIFLGNGDGTFQAGASYAVGNDPVALVTGDLNNDGKLDLVLCNFTDNTISVLLGNGDGTFQSPKNSPVGAGPVSLTLGDLNEDGTLDLILAVNDSITSSCIPFGSVEVLIGNGDGTFQSPQDNCLNTPLGGAGPVFVTTGDFNGDGKLDVVTANNGQEANYNVSILLGNGDGTFQPAQFPSPFSVAQPSSSAAVGDFNGDGKLDIALANVSSGFTAPGQSSYSIFLGNGDGTFQTPVTTELALETNPYSIQIADFNGDGKVDLVISSANGGNTGGTFLDLVYIFMGNGDGTFQSPQGVLPASTPYGLSTSLATGDFNGDGKPDVVSLEQTDPAASIGPAILLDAGASTTLTVPEVAVPGSGPQLVQGIYSGDTLYQPSSSAPLSLNPIAQAPVTWSNPAAVTYGTALSATQLNATSTVGGNFVYTPAAGMVLGAGMQTLSVTFTPSDTADYTPATQTVTLLVNPAPLTVSANNAARVFGAANPTFTGTITGAVNGDSLTESFTSTATGNSPVGSYPIVPAISGAAQANYTITATNGTLTITQAGTTTSFALSNDNLALTATVVSVTTGSPTGSVSFYGGETLIGSAPLAAGVANYTVTALPAASVSITAQYSGDPDFTQSSSPPVPILATVPGTASLTVPQAGTTTDTLTVAAAPGYVGTLQFSCTGLPQNSACSFQPASVAFNGMNSPATVTLTIQTGQSSVAAIRDKVPPLPDDMPLIPAMAFWFPGWFATALGGRPRSRRFRLRGVTLALLMLAAGCAITACGGGNGTANSKTPAGTSTFQVNVTGNGALTQSIDLTLTVQ
jgi:MBG domain (YGX type)/Bacterial Ig-like domain (group 3)/FG-GAP-like repeat